MKILPKINGLYEESNGEFNLSEHFGIDNRFPAANQVFEERLQRIGQYMISPEEDMQIVYLQEEMENEAYQLMIENQNVTIKAAGESGYNNGLTTLYQLLARGKGKVRNCTIVDKPRFERRGVMLDVCRHFFSVEEVKRIIEQSALLKFNQFHWKLSEDQGFRMESTRFPELNKIGSWRNLAAADPMVLKGLAKEDDVYGGYYTKDEIRDVVSYAAARNIEVIPEISLPGHSSAILATYPQFTCTGEPLKVKNTFGIYERIICAGNVSANEFLYQLLDEVCELFPSKYIHLGGDEAPKKSWKSCPHCNKLMEEKGIHNYESLQSYLANKMITHIQTKGKTGIVWNESVIGGGLEESTVVQYWIEMAPGPSYVEPELTKGRKLILSSMNQFYCDYSYADIPMKATLMYEPEVKGIKVSQENVLGIESPMWTEWTPENEDIEKMMYPRLLAVAECGWTKKRDWEDFVQRAESYLSIEALNILTPMPWEQATIHGKEALKMIVKNMLELSKKYSDMSQNNDEDDKAQVVLPEGTEPIDPSAMMRHYIHDKMKAAYTQEEINEVLAMMMETMAGAMS
ncbi:MAG: Beta-hexosaminidase [Herbinix sp.]|jgi:hexosaminidase|nr:Beta-hexosaminidase [Herbinix sp.]